MRQGPPVCLHNRPIEGPCRDCEIESLYRRFGGCDAGDPCPHPNLQPLESERMKLLRSGGPVFLTSGDVDPEPPAEPVDWQPDWQPSVWGPS